MNLILDKNLGNSYSSKSQKIRVITENWVSSQIFCPSCGNFVYSYVNNKPVADFYCKKCVEDFELKSKKGKISKKVFLKCCVFLKMEEKLKLLVF